MKKVFSILAMTAVVLGLASCGGNSPESNHAPEGAIKGKFTVDAGKQVYFSNGNLQYNAHSDIWRFAEHQWDYVGHATKGTVVDGGVKSNNMLISENYAGWIDLFGWGTGKNPTLTSKDDTDYPEFFDWGKKPIENGGNKANEWRTLSQGEWEYLFRKRDNAEALFGLGTVNGINGAIILPDEWETPKELEFTSSVLCEVSGLGHLVWNEELRQYRNIYGKNFEHNTYTVAQWSKMEAAGAVFLPAGGYRYRNGYGDLLNNYIGTGGWYWSSTPHVEHDAYSVTFDSNYMDLMYYFAYTRQNGLSVRLVQDVNK